MALLVGNTATEARRALEALSQRFARLRPGAVREATLAGGAAGIALALAALDDVAPGVGHARGAARAIQHAVERAARAAMGPGLHDGLSGIAWSVARLVESSPEGDACTAFDAALLGALAVPQRRAQFDLVSGRVGVGVYALERLDRPAGRTLIGRVVSHLAETARQRRPGVAWRTDPAWLPERDRTAGMDYNLGVAHGTPGVIAFLGGVLAAEVDPVTQATARAALEPAVEWLLRQELTGAAGSFGTAAGPHAPLGPARPTWCHGDPGVAAALLVAARGAREPAWERAAVRIALAAAERDFAGAGVAEPGLCHGAAGTAHVFHRLYVETGEPRFAHAARTWFGRLLAMRDDRPSSFAGFRALTRAPRRRWIAEPGFLTGAAGIALALASAVADLDPGWDRALLLS